MLTSAKTKDRTFKLGRVLLPATAPSKKDRKHSSEASDAVKDDCCTWQHTVFEEGEPTSLVGTVWDWIFQDQTSEAFTADYCVQISKSRHYSRVKSQTRLPSTGLKILDSEGKK
jgi:hypothetical protein